MITKSSWVFGGLVGASLLAAGCSASIHGSASASASGSASSSGGGSSSGSGASASTRPASPPPRGARSSTTTSTVARDPAPRTPPPSTPPPPAPPRETVFGSTGRIDQAFTGNVYFLPDGTQQLPDFTTLQPVGTVYTRSIDIGARRFDQGFPGISERFEWFGVRYQGTLVVDRAGDYAFRIHSDDGARLLVDGREVVDNDGVHPPTSASGRVRLTPGSHQIVLEYFQGPRYEIALQLFWTPPRGQEAIFVMPEAEEATPRAETAFGSTRPMDASLTGNVYVLPENTSSLPDLSTLSSVGTVYTRKLDIPDRRFDEGFPGISDRYEWFAVRYQGTGFFPRGGNYSFRLHSDDGARLFIDGRLVVNNDGLHAPRSVSETVHLSAGNHEVVVEYFQGPRYQIALQLFWTVPGSPEAIFELPPARGGGQGRGASSASGASGGGGSEGASGGGGGASASGGSGGASGGGASAGVSGGGASAGASGSTGGGESGGGHGRGHGRGH